LVAAKSSPFMLASWSRFMPKNPRAASQEPQSFAEAWGWAHESVPEPSVDWDSLQETQQGDKEIVAQNITRRTAAQDIERQKSLNQAAGRAARANDLLLLNEFLEKGADAASAILGREFAMASERNSEAVARALFEAGAKNSPHVALALSACARRGFENPDFVLLLAQSPGLKEEPAGALEYALAAAARSDDFVLLAKAFLALGASPDGIPPGPRALAPPTGESPLEIAAHKSACAVLRLLLDAGAREHKSAALACALSTGAWESVAILEEAGASVDDSNVMIALYAESEDVSERVALWILERGVNPERVAAATLFTGFDNWGAFEAALDRGARGVSPQSPWRAHWERNAREGGELGAKAQEVFKRLAEREKSDLLLDLKKRSEASALAEADADTDDESGKGKQSASGGQNASAIATRRL